MKDLLKQQTIFIKLYQNGVNNQNQNGLKKH